MKIKNKKIIIVFSILVLICTMAGVSYAVWQMTLTQEDDNLITSSCFQVTMTEKNPISLQNAIPITDQDGESLVPYTFTIHNECGENALYEIHYEILNNTTFTEDEEQEFIKFKFQEEKPKLLNSLEKTDKTLTNANRAYVIERGYIKANETKNYELKVWLDENVTVEDNVMGKIFASEVTVTARYDREILTSPEVELVLSRCSDDIIASVKTSGNVIDTYEYTLDSEDTITENEATHTFTDQGRGTTHTIKVKVTDVYGNVTEKEEDIEIPEYPTLLGKKIGTDIPIVTNGDGLYEVTHCEGTIENDELTEVQKEGFLLEEYRYAGSNPDNYITFNNETWRIIGLVNVLVPQDDGTEKVEQRVKIVKDESIGQYSWDTSSSDINSGYGVNEWSQADLMKLLNPGYENNKLEDTNGTLSATELVNNSLYWTGGNGNCYNDRNNATISCNFEGKGMKEESKQMIEDVIWNTGSYHLTNLINVPISKTYEYEREKTSEKLCDENDQSLAGYEYVYSCTDKIERKSSWLGKIALIYISDFGYSVGNDIRSSCLDKGGISWDKECASNSWIYKSELTRGQFTLNVQPFSGKAWEIYFIYIGVQGIEGQSASFKGNDVYPSLYLKPTVQIQNNGNSGNASQPYSLEIQN